MTSSGCCTSQFHRSSGLASFHLRTCGDDRDRSDPVQVRPGDRLEAYDVDKRHSLMMIFDHYDSNNLSRKHFATRKVSRSLTKHRL